MRRMYMASLGRWLAMGMTTLAQPVLAQPASSTVIVPAPPTNDPADRLAANLVILSQNPRDVRALTEAGLSAIAVGDGDAALSFLARAEEISPGNGKIKAAIGSALLLKQKPTDALRLFGEAVSLGYPEQSVARDRGLAFDLRGDSKRAQRDYALALRGGPDDELTIRYALSLGISGDDDKAQELLDPLLRQRNLAAWRARSFVLAMNGDTNGAEVVANAVMPGGSGASMSPFLHRLAALNAAERALAVNYGIMPSGDQRFAAVETGDPYRPSGAGGASDGLIPAGDPLGPHTGSAADQTRRPPALVSKEPRRRPGRESVTLTAAHDDSGEAPVEATGVPVRSMSERVGARIGPVDPERLPAEVRAVLNPGATSSAGGSLPRLVVTGATSLPPPSGAPAPMPATSQILQAEQPPAARFEVSEASPSSVPIAQTAKSGPARSEAPSAHVAQQTEDRSPSGAGLGAILANLQVEPESVAAPLPTAAEMKTARVVAQRKAAAEAKAEAEAKAAKDVKEAERLAAKKHPARIWVQVATGSNEAGLPSTWKKLKDKAPTVFKGQNASSVPFKATNRLLVGPFKSQTEARALVNSMKKAGLQGSTFASDAGQAIAKVSSR